MLTSDGYERVGYTIWFIQRHYGNPFLKQAIFWYILWEVVLIRLLLAEKVMFASDIRWPILFADKIAGKIDT